MELHLFAVQDMDSRVLEPGTHWPETPNILTKLTPKQSLMPQQRLLKNWTKSLVSKFLDNQNCAPLHFQVKQSTASLFLHTSTKKKGTTFHRFIYQTESTSVLLWPIAKKCFKTWQAMFKKALSIWNQTHQNNQAQLPFTVPHKAFQLQTSGTIFSRQLWELP